jgi:hypothetical protein
MSSLASAETTLSAISFWSQPIGANRNASNSDPRAEAALVISNTAIAGMSREFECSRHRPAADRIGKYSAARADRYSLSPRKRRAFAITETELRDIASAATIGLSRMPKAG